MDSDGGNRDALARAVAQALMAREGTEPAWGLMLEDARPGYARVAMVVRPDMLDGHGTAHGGLIFALANRAFAYACNARNEVAVGSRRPPFASAPCSPASGSPRKRETATAGRSGVHALTVCGGDERAVTGFQGLSRTIGGPVFQDINNG